LHTIKLEPYSSDDEKIKKKREKKRWSGRKKTQKQPWPWVVGLAVTYGWPDQPPTAYLRFRPMGLCTKDLSNVAALKKTNASLLASVQGEASCQNSHGEGSDIFKGDKKEVQQDKINRKYL
jgi:hypothetical protein